MLFLESTHLSNVNMMSRRATRRTTKMSLHPAEWGWRYRPPPLIRTPDYRVWLTSQKQSFCLMAIFYFFNDDGAHQSSSRNNNGSAKTNDGRLPHTMTAFFFLAVLVMLSSSTLDASYLPKKQSFRLMAIFSTMSVHVAHGRMPRSTPSLPTRHLHVTINHLNIWYEDNPITIL